MTKPTVIRVFPVHIPAEIVASWHETCDREGIPVGTIVERVRLLMDSHRKIRWQQKETDKELIKIQELQALVKMLQAQVANELERVKDE